MRKIIPIIGAVLLVIAVCLACSGTPVGSLPFMVFGTLLLVFGLVNMFKDSDHPILANLGAFLFCIVVLVVIVYSVGFTYYEYKPDRTVGYYTCTKDYPGFEIDCSNDANSKDGVIDNVTFTFNLRQYAKCVSFKNAKVYVKTTINDVDYEFDFSLHFLVDGTYSYTHVLMIPPTYQVSVNSFEIADVTGSFYFEGTGEPNGFFNKLFKGEQYKFQYPSYTLRVIGDKILFINFDGDVAYLNGKIETPLGASYSVKDLIINPRFSFWGNLLLAYSDVSPSADMKDSAQKNVKTIIIDDKISASDAADLLKMIYALYPNVKTIYIREIDGDCCVSDARLPEAGVDFYIGDESFTETSFYESLNNTYFVNSINPSMDFDISEYQDRYGEEK